MFTNWIQYNKTNFLLKDIDELFKILDEVEDLHYRACRLDLDFGVKTYDIGEEDE